MFCSFHLCPDQRELVFISALSMDPVPKNGIAHKDLMCRFRVNPSKVDSPLGDKSETTTLNSFEPIDSPLLLVPRGRVITAPA